MYCSREYFKTSRLIQQYEKFTLNRANISFGDIKNGQFLLMFPRTFLNVSIDIVGDFNILAFSVLISSVINVAKFVLCHISKLLTLV